MGRTADRHLVVFRARLDMELDAFLLLALGVLVWLSGKVGAWVILIGALRYLFVAGGWVWPPLQATLPSSQRRKTICVIQGWCSWSAWAPSFRRPWRRSPRPAPLRCWSTVSSSTYGGWRGRLTGARSRRSRQHMQSADALASLSRDLPELALGAILFATGLTTALLLSLGHRAVRSLPLTSFGAAVLLYGVRLFTSLPTFRAIAVGPPLLWDYTVAICTYLLPVTVFVFSEHFFGPGWRSSMRRVWQIHLVYAVAAIDAANEMYRDTMVSDDTWSALSEHYDTHQMMSIVAAAARYRAVSMTLNAFGCAAASRRRAVSGPGGVLRSGHAASSVSRCRYCPAAARRSRVQASATSRSKTAVSTVPPTFTCTKIR